MEWKIKRGNEACAQCEKSFEQGEFYYSTIDLEEHSIVRLDYCSACFHNEEAQKKEVFWRAKNTAVKPVKKTVNFEILRALFYKMISVEDPKIKELAYLIALILIRKKFLRLKDFISQDGKDYMTVHQKKGSPNFKVEVPLLKEEEIVLLRDKLGDLLDADLDESMEINEIREMISPTEAGDPS